MSVSRGEVAFEHASCHYDQEIVKAGGGVKEVLSSHAHSAPRFVFRHMLECLSQMLSVCERCQGVAKGLLWGFVLGAVWWWAGWGPCFQEFLLMVFYGLSCQCVFG